MTGEGIGPEDDLGDQASAAELRSGVKLLVPLAADTVSVERPIVIGIAFYRPRAIGNNDGRHDSMSRIDGA